MRRFLAALSLALGLAAFGAPTAHAEDDKKKFYDFSDQLIDGQVKRPSTLYTDSRDKVKFDRLLKLDKDFLPALYETAKEPIFR